MADALTDILRAASKHPNSRVSKLIHQVEEEPTQKNIVLLLIELAEHNEYSIDFSVSLKYYLELFERCGINHDLVLNEAGLLLVNSSKIYSKRLDFVQSLVERQILALSNADDELEKQKLEQAQTENATPAEKPKRGRKRALEATSDPYEVELAPKKFKKLTEEKRFALPKVAIKCKIISRNIEVEQHIHPAGWQHATIYDLDNEEDVDTKRNYKLFTFHVEHRYNTLVPDINFRLHFKVKDYMDELEEMDEDEACNTDRSWPPLSEAYVQKYLRIENYVLGQDMKTNKRKSRDQDEQTVRNAKRVINIEEPANKSQKSPKHGRKSTELESSSTLDQNDSGLGESILTESLNTLETTQLDCALTNSQTQENLSKIDDNSALESSLLEQSNSVRDETAETDSALEAGVVNKSSENVENYETTEGNQSEAKESDMKSTKTEPENDMAGMLEISHTQEEILSKNNTSAVHMQDDSALGSSILEQSSTENAAESKTSENNEHSDITKENLNGRKGREQKSPNSAKAQPENNTSLHAEVIEGNPTSESTCKTIDDNREVLHTISKEGKDLEKLHVEELAKTTDSRRDSALDDDRVLTICTEDLAADTAKELTNIESGKNLSIDIIGEQNKNATQIHERVPLSGDDEGVCLSDLEEQDCRLLSPIIRTTNILPGVGRKDVTIVMDDELCQALEMRDGIIKHFGYETFTLPVTTEPRKANLIFNILKLPEKQVRRKILFKLGPDMDLYLKARLLKRPRADPVARVGRNFQFLKWFSLNNTDMTGVSETPPRAPGNDSPEFHGFTDTEDDAKSCDGFCGFTEEEQLTLNTKSMSRLSRDSGVGVDVNNLSPDKETMEIIFEEDKNLAKPNCKRNLNSKIIETETETTDEILKQLPDDIRNALSLELDENNESNNKQTSDAINSNTPLTSKSSQEVQNIEFQLDETTRINSESTEVFPASNTTKESANSSENCSLTQTQTTESVLTENSNETNTCAAQSLISSETSTATESQQKPSEIEAINQTESNTEDLRMMELDMICKNASSAAELVGIKSDFDDCAEGSDDDKMNDANDSGIMLDLDSQGTKTKIQQWHEHLQPILAKSRERHHFDIFKLGTEIIDTVQTPKTTSTPKPLDAFSNSSTASFEDIMMYKDKSYVSRYFLSTLLLANQSNIEISIQNKSLDEPSSWHDINLKLLNTKRHTVAIEDNIGMIDSEQKTKSQRVKQTATKQVHHRTPTTSHHDESGDDEDEPLIKLQSPARKLKTPLKRISADASTSSCTAAKRPKEILFATPANRQHTPSPILIQSVQNLQPPFAFSSANNGPVQPSTSHEAQHRCLPFFNVNTNAMRTLQPIEKVQQPSDDYDSGIFSVDEMSTS